jgi:hypothetical protein
MFRPCRAIFRENFLLLLHYGCTLQLSENVLLTVNYIVFGGVNPLWSRPELNISGVCVECELARGGVRFLPA